MTEELAKTIADMSDRGRGILAADESHKTIAKRFESIAVESTEERRRSYRELLFATEGLGEFVNGVILFEETLGQKTKEGVPFPKLLEKAGIVPGIKVDKGLISLTNSADEKVTQGLDGLPERLAQYKKMGARFAKWRAVFDINGCRPTGVAVRANVENLARYAAICQSQGIVPIVEPEVLMEGDHTFERCANASEHIFRKVFHALDHHKVVLEHMILKPSMVISGKDCPEQASVDEVAQTTLKILLRTVPAAVPTINFLSGGQTPELATAHLNRMNALHPHLPWNLTFSYGRALQEPALETWKGQEANRETAQQALYKRAKLNGAATTGDYSEAMEG